MAVLEGTEGVEGVELVEMGDGIVVLRQPCEDGPEARVVLTEAMLEALRMPDRAEAKAA